MSEEIEKENPDDQAEGKQLEAMENDGVKPVSESKPTNKLVFILPILLLIFFCLAAVFFHNRMDVIEKKFDQVNLKNDSTLKDTESRIKETLSTLTNFQKRLDELETKQDVLSHTLSQADEQQIYINEDYALSEVEHLLIIASYNLQLDHDVATALAAMEAADARLNGLSDPAVLGVRKQLIADMNKLRSMNQADLSGLGLFLSDLINRVDELPLQENVVIQKTQEKNESIENKDSGLKHFFTLVWQELKSLVVISRDKNVNKARLLPDEVYFLRANLKLELANARFAVFNRDTSNLHASIGHIQVWLKDYFDLSDASARNIYDSLSRMEKMELAFPDMDISSSLESVRALIRNQEESNGVVQENGSMP
jgi:uroporphyrin-III C-methyltransferase